MKVFIVIIVCVAVTVAVSIDSDSTQKQQNDLYSVNGATQSDHSGGSDERSGRSKRFFLWKLFYPVSLYSEPAKVVKYVEPAPVTIQVKPVRYTYTVTVPQISVVKQAPLPVVRAVPVSTATVTKTVSTTVEA